MGRDFVLCNLFNLSVQPLITATLTKRVGRQTRYRWLYPKYDLTLLTLYCAFSLLLGWLFIIDFSHLKGYLESMKFLSLIGSFWFLSVWLKTSFILFCFDR